MELQKKYFHSVHSYLPNIKYDSNERILELKDILDKYKKILESGYILPYAGIEKLYGNSVNRNRRITLNGNNCISVSLHEKNLEEVDLKMHKEFDGDVENAFHDFIMQEPSIVLGEKIKDELLFSKYPGIYLERLVKEPISLEYMEAISIFVPGYLQPFFNQTNLIDYEKLSHDTIYRIWPIEYVDQLLELLNNSNYHVPLVDVISGKEFRDNQEYRKVLSKNRSHL